MGEFYLFAFPRFSLLRKKEHKSYYYFGKNRTRDFRTIAGVQVPTINGPLGRRAINLFDTHAFLVQSSAILLALIVQGIVGIVPLVV